MDTNDRVWSYIGTVLLGAMVMMGVMKCTGVHPNQINQKWRKEAVALGYGKWVVDAEGHTTFEWIKLDNEKKPDIVTP